MCVLPYQERQTKNTKKKMEVLTVNSTQGPLPRKLLETTPAS